MYDYSKFEVHIRGPSKSSKDPKQPDRNFIVFTKNLTANTATKPAARYIRLEKKGKDVSLKLLQIEVYDYGGNKFRPISVKLFPQSNTAQGALATDGNLAADKPALCETQVGREVYIQLDFGAEIEIAGVRIYNALGEEGNCLVGADLRVCTKSGVAVFDVPIRDNRSLYNIRTSPLEALQRRAHGLKNEEFAVVPGFLCTYRICTHMIECDDD